MLALLLGAGCADLEPNGGVPPFTGGGDAGDGGDASDDGAADSDTGEDDGDDGADDGPDDGADDSAADDDGDTGADDGGVGVDGGPVDDDAGSDESTGEPVDPPPFDPLYRIQTRIHMGQSNMSDAMLEMVLEEMNFIWRSQAAVCFEFEVVNDDSTMSDGFDMWFKPEVGGPNGYYSGDHDIHVRDEPSLGNAPNPAGIAAARTAAHELGHGLTLSHDQNSDDYLMRSGTYGWEIPMYQIDEARARAAQKALPDTTLLDCGPPVFN